MAGFIGESIGWSVFHLIVECLIFCEYILMYMEEF